MRLLLLNLLLFLPIIAQSEVEIATIPDLSVDSVYVKTSQGDFVVSLYEPEDTVAVDHFRRLVRSGILNHTRVDHIVRENYIQMGYHGGAQRALTENQRYDLYPATMPPTPTTHRKYSVSFIPDTENKAVSAFAIVTRDAPEFDKDQSVFGEVIYGQETLARIEALPINQNEQPIDPIQIHAAFLVNSADAIAMYKASQDQVIFRDLKFLLPAGLVLILALLILYFFTAAKVSNKTRIAIVLSAGFVTSLMIMVSITASNIKVTGLPGLMIFTAFLAMFKLMNRFESQMG